MGYIQLTINTDEETVKQYVIFHAEYLNETWLAELHENGTTKIIADFEDKKPEQCLEELAIFIDHLGPVAKMSSQDIDADVVKQLKIRVMNEEIFEKGSSRFIPRHVSIPHYRNMWNRLMDSFAGFRMAH